MQGRSEAFDAIVADATVPDQRENVAWWLEYIAGKVREHGVVDLDGDFISSTAACVKVPSECGRYLNSVPTGRFTFKMNLTVDTGE